MSDLYIAAVCFGFVALGLLTPFVMALSYVWVDSFYPQYLSSLLEGIPVAQVTGLGAIAVYLLMDRRAPPRPGATTWLTLLMALWVTLTTTWAVAPEPAWIKWDGAFKTVAFSALVPLFFRSRVQIEAFLQVYLLSATAIMLPVGIKTLVSGGGYNINLTDMPHETPLSEGSGLATVACMFIPIILFLMRRAVILPPGGSRG